MNSIQTFVIIALVGILISLDFQTYDVGSYSYTINTQTIAIIISIALSAAIIVHTIRQKGNDQWIWKNSYNTSFHDDEIENYDLIFVSEKILSKV